MASTCLYTVSALFIVLLGCLPCKSEDCTYQSVSTCLGTGYDRSICPYVKNIADCLEGVATNCTNDVVLESINEYMAEYRARSEECGGLPPGDCLMSMLAGCESGIPYTIEDDMELTDQDKKKQCNTFNTKYDSAKKCVTAVRGYCVSASAIKILDGSDQRLDAISQICQGLE